MYTRSVTRLASKIPLPTGETSALPHEVVANVLIPSMLPQLCEVIVTHALTSMYSPNI